MPQRNRTAIFIDEWLSITHIASATLLPIDPFSFFGDWLSILS